MPKKLTAKTCLITGASTGIGFETALALAGMDATVIMVSSRKELLLAAAQKVIQQTNSNNVIAKVCDLSNQASIHHLANQVLSDFHHLHILINNAGVFREKKQTTEDGFEKTFAVNHLAPFLLTNLLLGRLITSSPARIINLVSSYHKMGKIYLDDLNFTGKHYDGLIAYNQSKLANVMFSYKLAGKLTGTNVTVNCSDPWGTKSNICQEKGFYNCVWTLLWPFLQSAQKGAQTSIYLASSDEVKNITGKYFRHNRSLQSSKTSQDKFLSAKLWVECEKLTGISYDSVISSCKTITKPQGK